MQIRHGCEPDAPNIRLMAQYWRIMRHIWRILYHDRYQVENFA